MNDVKGLFNETKIVEIEISYKPIVKQSQLPQILQPVDAYNILRQLWDKDKIDFIEQFKVMLLNRNSRVLGICAISTGSSAGTIADPKIIFSVAIRGNASGIIIAHNHPSGSLKPSENDYGLTERIKQCGRLLDVMVKDSIIITSEGYYSFAEEGAL